MKPLNITENQKEKLGKLIRQYYEGDYDQETDITHIKQYDEYEHGYVWDFVGWYYGEPDDRCNEEFVNYDRPLVYDNDYLLIPE